tara:strand:- start:351 stop:908 length:558 start_codon:yes stop_codon:yes gene_type:complete
MFDKIKINTEEPIVKNPFACKIEGFENKFFNVPNFTRTKGYTDNAEIYETIDGNHQVENKVDSKMNFVIGKELKSKKPYELVSTLKNYDFIIPAEEINKKSKCKTHTDGLPISFIQIDNIKDGVEWYRANYPKIPDELYPIIARYHWGNAINKNTLRKERKALKSKKKKEVKKLERTVKDINLTW